MTADADVPADLDDADRHDADNTGDAADTARWLAARFALGRVHGMARVARGASGEVHRLVSDQGAYAVKRAFWREATDEVVESRARVEVGLVERCRVAGLRAPSPVVSVDGSVVARDDRDRGWRVHDFAPGAARDRSDLPAERWVLEQGAVIHRLALDPAPGDAVDEWYTTVARGWEHLAAGAEDAGADWPPLLRDRAAELADLGDWATSVPQGDLVLCHRDLTADNTLVEPDGTRWLLDWDDVGAHEPAREVGTVLLHHVRDEGALAVLAAAYGSAGGVELPEGAELFASGVAVWLNVLAAQVGVLLDSEAESEHQDFALPAVRGLLADLPPLGQLERCGLLAGQAANRARAARPRTMRP
jgi:Ser/Thr protein kinase RdoA (MazF antagonist)